jgi:hypothetical protein
MSFLRRSLSKDHFHFPTTFHVASDTFSLISSVEISGLVIVIVGLSDLVAFLSFGLGLSSILIFGILGRRTFSTYNRYPTNTTIKNMMITLIAVI